jgi:NAD(P)H-hydrate epimerase
VDLEQVAALRRRRDTFSYKNKHGHAFIAAGSYGKAGAALLSTAAALRSGTGLVTAIVPELCYDVLQTGAPEAMCQVAGAKYLDALTDYEAATAIGVGPGIGTKEDTVRALSTFLDNCNLPCVLDADALNIIARHKELLHKIPANSILTPHPGECRRLFGDRIDSMQQAEHIRLQAMRYNICILLKGHHTVIATPDGDCYYNMTGNAGMAKGGSGDVLTGLLTGLLAQGYTAAEAAIMGVYLHGKAGDLALSDIAMEAMKAGDIINYLNPAWQTLGKI